MAGWTIHQGRAVHLGLDNIDTDQLIPARFMSTPRAEGYGQFLLHDLRSDPEFPLNRHRDVSILVAGRNFGTGSSREAAVYALFDAGFRAVIAPSFGDIFAANAVNNGLLPARVSDDAQAELAAFLAAEPAEITIDLNTRTIALDDRTFPFDVDESWRTKLINGWDDIDLTRQHADKIAAFAACRAFSEPWVFPTASD
ncbi:3-isopropylmalate dehydratase small subunit [Roseobacter weihaiensis]|uniref:3-isopropylmalate dehydratase small subunit n=1 Tax=Roseobacter weihaiensis TaxID=2763262 RepID=UPI001D09E438|nr:3-isopropylmalate dehydratase small subunit [Roseobacter sp. H9]